MDQVRDALSANEAASVTGVPLKHVHRIIDSGLLDGAVEKRAGIRLIRGGGVIGLKLAHETAHLLTPEVRRRVVRRLLEVPGANTVFEDAIAIDMRPMNAAVRKGLDALSKAKKMVATDKAVLGGTPCFRDTRIPVHDIAEMIANGDSKEAVLEAYPQLKAEQIDLAVLYAQAYPRRGRPRRKPPWRGSAPVSSEKLSPGELPDG
jgi:uncharacterized protein (DUF433 family)